MCLNHKSHFTKFFFLVPKSCKNRTLMSYKKVNVYNIHSLILRLKKHKIRFKTGLTDTRRQKSCERDSVNQQYNKLFHPEYSKSGELDIAPDTAVKVSKHFFISSYFTIGLSN